jgi:signal transduction histidine kinase
VLSERERIARELHDTVIQRLFAVGMQLQAASRSGPADLEARLDAAVRDVDDTIRDIRRTIFELQTQGGDTLRGDLQAAAREHVGPLGFTPSVRTSGPLDTVVPAVLRDQLLLVLHAALSNVGRHAQAGRAEVEVVLEHGQVRLTVLDDGVGLGPGVAEVTEVTEAADGSLAHARETVRLLGGELDLTTDPTGGGAVLRWRAPLDPAGQA